MRGFTMVELLSGEGFMPHGMCFLWRPDVLALHVISDGLIALAYCSIPFSLILFMRRRGDLQFSWMIVCFAVFIIACGATHLMEIWTIWHPDYWLSGGIKGVTAVASISTAILLVKLIPHALRLPSPAALKRANTALEREVCERARAEEQLLRANETLERRVAERTSELEALNRTLIQDNAHFAIAANAAGLGFWSFDVATNALQWDEMTGQLYGQTGDDGLEPHARWMKSLHPEDRDRCAQEIAEALAGRATYDTEFRIVHPDGAIRHLRGAARTTRGKDGKVSRMFGVNFDVTDLKRADEKFRLAIEAAPTGMLLMSLTGVIVMVNAQIENLFGYTREELLGQSIEMLVPARFRRQHPGFRSDFFRSPRARPMGAGKDLAGLRKDGSEVPIEIGLNPLHTSEGDFVLSSIIDLSQRRAMDRMRTDFVSTVSHELRTPLTSISASLGLLESGALGPLPTKMHEMVQIANKNSGRLVRLINDILDIGKLEAGELSLEPIGVSLAALLRQSIEANLAYAEKDGIRFVFQDETDNEQVIADPGRLMQVATNLLSNAVKFSPPGGEVLIRVRPRAHTLRVEIEDFGSGIPESFRDRIFEKFAQADASATRRHEGTGLGLSISHKLIEAMGGKIGYSSVVGQGTIFHFELPRSRAPVARSDTDGVPVNETG